MRAYRLDELLTGLDGSEVRRLLSRWGCVEDRNGESRSDLQERMQDPELIRDRTSLLPGAERRVLGRLLERKDRCLSYQRLLEELPVSESITSHEIEQRIERLAEHGLVFRIQDRNSERHEVPAIAMPDEIARVLEDMELLEETVSEGPPQGPSQGPQKEFAPAGPYTLKEHLEQKHFQKEGDAEKAHQHARQAYKLFLMPNAVFARIRRLPDEVRELVELAMTRYGGILPRSLYEQTVGEDPIFDREDLDSILREALIGTVGQLDLRRYGIQLSEPTLLVFQEVTLVFARSGSGKPTPREEQVAGVDLATNVMRFLRYVDENGVRFTVKGEIFRTTYRRLLGQLLTRTGGEDVETSFQFLYRFCLASRFIERTGERTFRVSERGRAFEEQDLPDKIRELLAFAVDDEGCSGDPFHQVRLRRILLRLLRRLDPGTWYDAMYLPFLARNSYLTSLPEQGALEYYEQLSERGRQGGVDNLRQLSWDLFHWVRKRLHVLGLVDLGYEDGHVTALRVSNLGASLLSGVPAKDLSKGRSMLLVNPDFEILLFPESDAPELVHCLDRFAKRTGSDRLYRFQLSEESVRSALADGMDFAEMLSLLSDRCRTPLPQNVIFSLEDWADRAGLLFLDADRGLSARRPETLQRLRSHQRIHELCDALPDGDGLRLKEDVAVEDFKELLRDLGFHLEDRAA